jgi:hypothetical protein
LGDLNGGFKVSAEHQRLMPITLATHEVGLKPTLGKIVHDTLSWKKEKETERERERERDF